MGRFEFVPLVGAEPLRFGMISEAVRFILGPETAVDPNRSGTMRAVYDSVAVTYDAVGKAVEFHFVPRGAELAFRGKVILGPGAVEHPVRAFLAADPEPREFVGFLVFGRLGVGLTGYHDGDVSQEAINLGARGVWSEIFQQGSRPDLSRFSSSMPQD